MSQAPRTMTLIGLKFLGALSAQKRDGVYLEIGPLFGSSTNYIHDSRVGDAPIHTIDTFEAAPWVRKRLGIDLSREMFDKFTRNIDNLIVHEGFAPDVVKDTWNNNIGFYFDDAIHGDPGWTDNFEFFSQFFNDETIICGDDFASGWPDIVRNVYAYAEDWGVKLFVMGRVWAITRKDEGRIVNAVNAVCPKLEGVDITTRHGDDQRRNMAACWSWGLHRNTPLDSFSIKPEGKFSGQVVTIANDTSTTASEMGKDTINLQGIKQICFTFNKKLTVQLCLANAAGKTQNTKTYKSGQVIDIPDGAHVTALRLSDT